MHLNRLFYKRCQFIVSIRMRLFLNTSILILSLLLLQTSLSAKLDEDVEFWSRVLSTSFSGGDPAFFSSFNWRSCGKKCKRNADCGKMNNQNYQEGWEGWNYHGGCFTCWYGRCGGQWVLTARASCVKYLAKLVYCIWFCVLITNQTFRAEEKKLSNL